MSWRHCVIIGLLLYIYNVNSQCTSTDSNTCNIDRTTSINNRQNITCSPLQSNCKIQCLQTTSCSTNIYCPFNGDSCIINCVTDDACSDAHIIPSNCQHIEINIAGDTYNMDISAPNNGGSLEIDISDNILNDIEFKHNNIYSLEHTNNMIINCNGDCSDNNINAFDSNILNISCIYNSNTICDNNDIQCPNECNILCHDCSDTSVTKTNINSINWECKHDCSNSSLSDNNNAIKTWTECNEEWLLLLDTDCPTTTTINNDDDDDFNQQEFTILAFVLIGTVIGCLCVIVVTTIICCICWHEHQIKALNIQQNKGQTQTNNNSYATSDNNNTHTHTQPQQKVIISSNAYDNDNDNNNNNIHNGHHNGQYNHNNNNLNVTHPHSHITISEHTPSIPGSSEASPVPQSVSRPDNQSTYSHSPEMHSRNKRKKSGNNKRGSSNASSQHSHQVQYTQPPQQQNSSFDSSQSSGNKRGNSNGNNNGYRDNRHNTAGSSIHSSRKKSSNADRESRHSTHSKKRKSSKNVRTSNKSNKGQDQYYNKQQIENQIQIEQQIANAQQQYIPQKIKKRDKKISYDEEIEATDDVFPLQNDRIGQHYNDQGQYDPYTNRKKNKEQIKMQLAAYPSEISAGTTGTAEMNFVGSNYREYNPMINNNSYFKEDPNSFEPSAKTDLSLGDLDSGTTVTTVTSSIAMETITPTTTAQSPEYNFKQYKSHKHQGQHQGQHQYQAHNNQYQGSGNSGRNGRKGKKKRVNDIKIMQPHGQGKVKQVERTQMRANQNSDNSPTLTYSSPTANY